MAELLLPKLYVLVDAGVLASRGVTVEAMAVELVAAGVTLVQYRDKRGEPQEVLAGAALLRAAFSGVGCTLVMNDRADLAVLAGFEGVHVGQGDLSPEDARAVGRASEFPSFRDEAMEGWGRRDSGPRRGLLVGISTHTDDQIIRAEASGADYVAIGPVFATGTKADAAAVVGLEGVRRARALTSKPLVAIGGITRANCRSVMEAGADSVAVISGLFAPGERVAMVARDFLEILR